MTDDERLILLKMNAALFQNGFGEECSAFNKLKGEYNKLLEFVTDIYQYEDEGRCIKCEIWKMDAEYILKQTGEIE